MEYPKFSNDVFVWSSLSEATRRTRCKLNTRNQLQHTRKSDKPGSQICKHLKEILSKTMSLWQGYQSENKKQKNYLWTCIYLKVKHGSLIIIRKAKISIKSESLGSRPVKKWSKFTKSIFYHVVKLPLFCLATNWNAYIMNMEKSSYNVKRSIVNYLNQS